MYGDANEHTQADADPQFLTGSFPDDELERAAASERGQAVNTAYCTQWWICPF